MQSCTAGNVNATQDYACLNEVWIVKYACNNKRPSIIYYRQSYNNIIS